MIKLITGGGGCLNWPKKWWHDMWLIPNGDNRKKVWFNEVGHTDYHHSLIGSHAFAGNGYIFAFFRKGKIVCWKTMVKCRKLLDAFSSLSKEWELTFEVRKNLQLYVCKFYSSKQNKVIDTRFKNKQNKDTPPSQHAWYDNCTIQWINEMYPHDVSSLLLAQIDDSDEIYGEEDDFDDEEDYWVYVKQSYYFRSD